MKTSLLQEKRCKDKPWNFKLVEDKKMILVQNVDRIIQFVLHP